MGKYINKHLVVHYGQVKFVYLLKTKTISTDKSSCKNRMTLCLMATKMKILEAVCIIEGYG